MLTTVTRRGPEMSYRHNETSGSLKKNTCLGVGGVVGDMKHRPYAPLEKGGPTEHEGGAGGAQIWSGGRVQHARRLWKTPPYYKKGAGHALDTRA